MVIQPRYSLIQVHNPTFIDVSFVSRHNITQSSTQHSTSVHMADGTSYPVNSYVSDAISEINDYTDHITLDAIPLTAYDIIHHYMYTKHSLETIIRQNRHTRCVHIWL